MNSARKETGCSVFAQPPTVNLIIRQQMTLAASDHDNKKQLEMGLNTSNQK
jgi:hypothetical protein